MLKNKIFIILLIFLSNCQVAKLTDKSSNDFSAIATQGTYHDKVTVSWIAGKYYENYVVLRSDTINGTYVRISDLINASKFEDYSAKSGQEYHYKVQGYNKVGVALITTESVVGFSGIQGGFVPPQDITVSAGNSLNSLTLSWKRVDQAICYEILKSTDNQNFDIIAKTPYLHYIDKDVKLSQKYYYQITSIDKDGIPSPNRSRTVIGELFGYDVILLSDPGAYSDKIVLTWNKYQYATDYLVYRSLNIDTLGDKLAELSASDEMIYIDKDVEVNKLYYYTIVYKNNTIANKSSSVRNYLKVDGTPAKPQNVVASRGLDPEYVEITWNRVDGVKSYEIARSSSATGPWKIIGHTDNLIYRDKIPDDSYIYFYTVTGMNPALGAVSDIVSGWANKPPVNITASTVYGEKVELTWDKVPNAISYNISFSTDKNGTYNYAGSVPNSQNNRISYNHIYDIENALVQDIYYKIEVVTAGGNSVPSNPVKGTIKKIIAPNNLRIIGNQTPTKSMTIAWDRVDGARQYHIYRAILDHKNSDPLKLQNSHFKYVGMSQNAAYTIAFNSYPIRRYVYQVRAVDAADAEGVASASPVVWRYPVDAEDFAKDVDFTIIQAQTQIRNFGAQGSRGVVQGRAQGNYDYYAGFSGSKNIWNDYSSFEVILSGAQSVSVDISNFSARLNGPLNISGLYSGRVIYNNLNAKEGGFVFAGSITVEYNHPVRGKLTETWEYTKAGALLQSVVLLGSESPPKHPGYEQGYGN